MCKTCQSGRWSCFCCVGSSCEDIDSNQCLPLQFKLCKSSKGVIMVNMIYFFNDVKMAFMLISIIQFSIWTLSGF